MEVGGTVDEPSLGDDARRIGVAWRELRRGAAMNTLRPMMLGPYASVLDWGGLDTLDLLCQAEAHRMSELADVLRVDASTATRAIQRLVDMGFAERATDTSDRRSVVVRATEK